MTSNPGETCSSCDVVEPELWRPIRGYESFYQISSHGRVWSAQRRVRQRAGCRDWVRGARYLHCYAEPGRYVHVGLSGGSNGRATHQVHELVLAAFVSVCPEGMETRHLDGDPHHNCLQNLAWGTRSENMRDRVLHGTHQHTAQVTCIYGHLLVEPNVYQRALARGNRKCVACGRAYNNVRDYARKGVHLDFEAEAARHYEKLMGCVS